MKSLRIGSGAGYSGDRIEPAVELAEQGALGYLIFECLAERTIALAQQARREDPESGYDPLLERRLNAVLPICHRQGVTVISNMGAANPAAAARAARRIADRHGLTGLKIAWVDGDDVLDEVGTANLPLLETDASSDSLKGRMISANAYLGAAPLVEALGAGAGLILTGRVADPVLSAAPLIHEFGWSMDDWHRLGQATLVGHLLECAGQITGGYFADPGAKEVPDLHRLGYPLAEVYEDGSALITKVAGSGGRVSATTCKEQLLYEIHDPARYPTPDVVADFSAVTIQEEGPDRVRVSGASGHPRPNNLKVSIGYLDGFIGEGQISYGGPGAVARGRLALDIVAGRLALTGAAFREIRYDLIGVNSLFGTGSGLEPDEVRARVAARTDTLEQARRIGDEVEALYTNGPAAGGGAVKSTREVLAVASVLLPRHRVTPRVHYLEA